MPIRASSAAWAGLAAKHQATLRQHAGIGAGIEQRTQVRRHDFQRIDVVCRQVGGETVGIEHRLALQQMYRLAGPERAKQHGMPKVGGRRGDHGEVFQIAKGNPLGQAFKVIGQRPMRHRDPLGIPVVPEV